MCLYPRRMINKKYTATLKNSYPVIFEGEEFDGHMIPEVTDERVLYVNVPCGHCVECNKMKANGWKVRMSEELKVTRYPYFITLTFAPDRLDRLCKQTRLKESNAVAKIAVRRFLERWRKAYKVSIKHWLITELGHEGTERIHLHGLLFSQTPITNDQLLTFWQYGDIWMGDYCTQKTINYIVKYITKVDTDHRGFYGEIMASPGIGKAFLERDITKTYKYIKGHSRTDYTLENGTRTKLPTYYKNKLYNEDEREKIWKDFMDANKVTIMGNTYHFRDTSNSVLSNITDTAQKLNIANGYGSDDPKWKKIDYNVTERMLKSEKKRRLAEIIALNRKKMTERLAQLNYL